MGMGERSSVESAIEQASASKEEKAAAVQKSLQEALQRECERTKCFERQLMSIEDADVTKQREEEQKRVVDVGAVSGGEE